MSALQCPCCRKMMTDIEENFEDEPSAEATVEGACEHCESTLRFERAVVYYVQSAD